MFVLMHMHRDSYDMSSYMYTGICPTENTRSVEQPLETMRTSRKPAQNISLPGEVSNEGSRQYEERESLIAGIQNIRQQRVSQICKDKINLIPRLPLRRYTKKWVVDHTHGVAFREIPKVGSTSWLCLMASAFYGVPADILSFKDAKPLRNFSRQLGVKMRSIKDLEYALWEYQKFVFVRHPLSRLLSAYGDRIERLRKGNNQKYRGPIVAFLTNKTTNSDMHITFRDFVRYIIATRKQGGVFDVHWKPLTLLVQPCQLHYNFIGKLETINDDSKYIFQHFYHDMSLIFPRQNTGDSRKYKHAKSIQEYYDELTSQELADVIDIYKDDFTIFGYEEIVPTR